MVADAVNYALLVEQPAKMDVADAVLWYRKAQPGLEVDFQVCFEEALNRILRHPEMYIVLMRQVRRALLPNFPYSVLTVLKGLPSCE